MGSDEHGASLGARSDAWAGLGCRATIKIDERLLVEPQQNPTFGQKVKMGAQAAVALARNPKALVALVKYQREARKQRRQS